MENILIKIRVHLVEVTQKNKSVTIKNTRIYYYFNQNVINNKLSKFHIPIFKAIYQFYYFDEMFSKEIGIQPIFIISKITNKT